MLSSTRRGIGMRTVEESSSSPSAEIIGSSDDLLPEILLRLPVKSLFRFKSVSKKWLSLITHPGFSRLKCRTPVPPPSALLLQNSFRYDGGRSMSIVHLDPSNSQTTAPFTRLSFSGHPQGVEIMHSCNGLFCCRSVELNLDSPEPKHYVCNPTTQQFATLPPPLHRVIVYGMNLAFDPSESDSYKVIYLPSGNSGKLVNLHQQIQIYSSESRSWRLCGAPRPFDRQFPVDFAGGVYWKGSIYWVGLIKGLVYFDVEEEVTGEMAWPPPAHDYHNERMSRALLGTKGHLHLVEAYVNFDVELIVHEMERDRSGWNVKYRVHLTGVPVPFPVMFGRPLVPVLSVVRKEKEEDSFLVLLVSRRIMGYNFKSKSLWKICDLHGRIGSFGQFMTFQYIDSLSVV